MTCASQDRKKQLARPTARRTPRVLSFEAREKRCGAKVTPDGDALRPLLRFPVYLWPDNDVPGREHMDRIAATLADMGHAVIRTIDWTEAPPKGDGADHPGDKAAIQKLAQAARRYEPKPLPDGAAILESVRAFIRRYVVTGDSEADTLGLWTAHNHAIDAAEAIRHHGVGVIVFNPLAGGLLTGKHVPGREPDPGTRFGERLGESAAIYRRRYWQQESLEAVQALKVP